MMTSWQVSEIGLRVYAGASFASMSMWGEHLDLTPEECEELAEALRTAARAARQSEAKKEHD